MKTKPNCINIVRIYNLLDVTKVIRLCDNCLPILYREDLKGYGYNIEGTDNYAQCNYCKQYTKVGQKWQKKTSKS